MELGPFPTFSSSALYFFLVVVHATHGWQLLMRGGALELRRRPEEEDKVTSINIKCRQSSCTFSDELFVCCC